MTRLEIRVAVQLPYRPASRPIAALALVPAPPRMGCSTASIGASSGCSTCATQAELAMASAKAAQRSAVLRSLFKVISPSNVFRDSARADNKNQANWSAHAARDFKGDERVVAA